MVGDGVADQVEAVSFQDTVAAVDRLDRVTAPTLVLWGADDGWMPTSMGDELTAAIPGARQERIPDAGHFLPEDAPEATAGALLRHLA